jgi:hypothetical protein
MTGRDATEQPLLNSAYAATPNAPAQAISRFMTLHLAFEFCIGSTLTSAHHYMTMRAFQRTRTRSSVG